MTPWNIVGMAKLKGLDVIAVTDHNSALNLPQTMKAAQALTMEVIPGLEVTSREEVHVLAYFLELAQALAFGELIDAHLPEVRNRPALFGHQMIIGNEDAQIDEKEKLLIAATDFGTDALMDKIVEYGGVAVPAHINRGSNGMLGALGMMPMVSRCPIVEVYRGTACPAAATEGRFVLNASDAHRLGDISEPEFLVEAEAKTAQAIFSALRLEAIKRK